MCSLQKIDDILVTIFIASIISLIPSTTRYRLMFGIKLKYNVIQEYITPILQFIGIYLMWIIAHYFAPKLYIYFCVPSTIVGFILSPFASSMPHCIALRWIINVSAESIKSMWVVFGNWLIATVMTPSKQ